MSKVYQSVRGVVQETLHRKTLHWSKPDLLVSAPAKVNDGSLNNAIEELEKIFADGIGRLKAAVTDDQAVVASEAQHAAQVVEGLKANITVLETKLGGLEDTVHRKEVASQKSEESLSTEIRDLQNLVKKKEEVLDSRESEVNDLKSKIDVLVEQVTQSELAIQQAKAEAVSETQDAEQAIEGLKIKIATLQTQLSQTEQIVAGLFQSWSSPSMVESVPPIDLNAELEPQTNGMKDSKGAALVGIQAQAMGTVVAGEQLKTGEEKSTTLHFLPAGVTPLVPEAARETVSQDAFDRMIAEFSELTNVMESIATLIVRDQVRAFGESMEEFPQARLTELLESLSEQISDDKLKADFCERFGRCNPRRNSSVSST